MGKNISHGKFRNPMGNLWAKIFPMGNSEIPWDILSVKITQPGEVGKVLGINVENESERGK